MSDYANSKSSLVFRAKRPLGEILVEAGLITPAQISVALSEQQQQVKLKIGEILVAHGWIEKKTIEFFVHDWQKILTNHKKKKKPLVYYFNKSGLINKQQINLILAEQKQRKEKVRFHTLAIEKRYIKPITVSFFLAYIFDIYINTSNLYYSLKPYEIISKYVKGERDFSQTELSNLELIGVSLKQVKLNGSDLSKINLKSSNLSDSEMIQVNLTAANLQKTILSRVKFKNACLQQANLQGAFLDEANFRNTSLQGANLQNSYLHRTMFFATDLRKCQLPEKYPYDVYYDKETLFDPDFQPEKFGWKLVKNL